MKIAYLASADVAIMYLLLNQMKAIRSAGHDVHAICKEGLFRNLIEEAGFVVHHIPFQRKISPIQDIKTSIMLYQLLRREKYDLIHTHTPKASLLGQWVAWIARVHKRVHTIQGLYIPAHASSAKQIFWYMIEKLTMYPAHLITSHSVEDIITAKKRRLAKPSKLRYPGNGVDLSRFNPNSVIYEDKYELKKQLNIPDNQIIIGMVGRMVAEKGFFEFFKSAELVSQQFPNCTFLCIGPEEPDKVDGINQKAMHKAQQGADIRFLGLRSDLPQLYALMTILVHPSYREGFPRVPMEAAAMGLPMIVTNIRGCREIITHEVNGLLISPQDAHGLADAIIRLIRNPEDAQRFAIEAHKKAQAEFDEQVVFQRVLAAYAQL